MRMMSYYIKVKMDGVVNVINNESILKIFLPNMTSHVKTFLRFSANLCGVEGEGSIVLTCLDDVFYLALAFG